MFEEPPSGFGLNFADSEFGFGDFADVGSDFSG
jgi:hypothetical protein